MIDFMTISTRSSKKGIIEIYPKFIIYQKTGPNRSSDLMIRGGDFYAVWIEELGLWSTNEQDALKLIDRELDKYAEEYRGKYDGVVRVLHMWDAESGMIDSWHKFCQKQLRDSFHMLDEKLIFSNTETKKQDYASKKLDYPLEAGDTTAYDRLMSVLYSDKERHKIEWAIGSVVSGDSKKLQKFIVLYGSAGTGKSTVLNIIQMLFNGYYSVFDAKALGSSSNSFALEAFKSNPLVAIQHDGDLSRIEDNTRLNSLVSHELMTVNEKFRSAYSNRFKCFLFIGTNKPVKITDAKSGLIRRLIDVSPTGNRIPQKEYYKLTKQIEFELGGIAKHCLDVYTENPSAYDNYIPISMLGASNDFYNFMIDSYHVFKKEDGTTLKAAWEMYKTYCDDAKITYPFSQRIFKEELKNYFKDYKERFGLDDGTRVRSYYSGFKTDKFEGESEIVEQTSTRNWVELDKTTSLLDDWLQNCPAQYASEKGTPLKAWASVSTTLKDINTKKLHYVKPPESHIVIDFDILDETGNKSLEKNLEAASKWPKTYAELSKSEKGIHLHYIYKGDVSKLGPVYDDHIEIKTFSGNSSLRRKVSKCNDIPIATISSGLPLKGDKKVLDFEGFKNEKSIRTIIKKNLNKEYHPNTKPSIDFIYKVLEDAYASGVKYDVSDMRNAVLAFGASSSNQAEYCIKLIGKMHFKSDTEEKGKESSDPNFIFYDVEVFPNLFLVSWKRMEPNINSLEEYKERIKTGLKNPVVHLINPSPSDIEELISYPLIGFNNRRYDNHMLYGRLMGYTDQQLYNLSQKIINEGKGFFGEAYNLSYTDIYDFSSKKQGLKKFEIELGIYHKELGLPWDKPVPEEKWPLVAEYCAYDVVATEATFIARSADFTARKVLADISGMTVNDTTNSLTAKIIFGNDKNPQKEFNYRFIGCDELPWEDEEQYTAFDEKGRPIFPGYKFECVYNDITHTYSCKSTYRGEEVGEGGYVYAEPGIYLNVALLDIASMHPSSAIAEELFGQKYTQRFKALKEARIAIKHKEFDKAADILNGISKYLKDEKQASDLAQALKIVINMVYGLTSAKFQNPFYDERNKDNIVAKRGALFMVNLKHEVQKRGFTVAHIKTDSIKIPNATPEIIQFVMEYGQKYGYTFEHEATYDRMCLVNDAVYIARYKDGKHAGEWTATGTQFQVPYVFKTLFSKEPITFDDMCETKSVTTALYLDMNEKLEDPSEYEKELAALNKNEGSEERKKELLSLIEKCHAYCFVGKVGRFAPIKPGHGGGVLVRENINKKTGERKFVSATGSKNYRWLESEMVKELGKEEDIDRSYYTDLVYEAKKAISEYGDFEWFVSDDLSSQEELSTTLFDVR